MRSILFYNYDPIPTSHSRLIGIAQRNAPMMAQLAAEAAAERAKMPIKMPAAQFSEKEMLEQNRKARYAEVQGKEPVSAPRSDGWHVDRSLPTVDGEYETYWLTMNHVNAMIPKLKMGFRRTFYHGQWVDNGRVMHKPNEGSHVMCWRELTTK